jgi:hypothetical protein
MAGAGKEKRLCERESGKRSIFGIYIIKERTFLSNNKMQNMFYFINE